MWRSAPKLSLSGAPLSTGSPATAPLAPCFPGHILCVESLPEADLLNRLRRMPRVKMEHPDHPVRPDRIIGPLPFLTLPCLRITGASSLSDRMAEGQNLLLPVPLPCVSVELSCDVGDLLLSFRPPCTSFFFFPSNFSFFSSLGHRTALFAPLYTSFTSVYTGLYTHARFRNAFLNDPS